MDGLEGTKVKLDMDGYKRCKFSQAQLPALYWRHQNANGYRQLPARYDPLLAIY